jgi:hypothetical protein
VSGADRYETSVSLSNLAINSLGYSATHVSVATGQNFPDALTGGTRAGRYKAPMVLTFGKSVPGIVCTFLGNRGPATTSGDVFGGTSAIAGLVKWNLQECLEKIG